MDNNDKFEVAVLTRLTAIESKIDDYQKIKDKVEESYNKSNQNEKEITEMKENHRWTTRAIISQFIAILGTIVFSYFSSK